MPWRCALPEDHAALLPLMLALYEEDPAPTPMTAAQAERTLVRLRAEPHRGVAVVLTEPGPTAARPVLLAYALLCSFWSNELGGEVCIVDELYVRPERRRQGIGSTFIDSLAARQLPWFPDAVAFELEVTPTNSKARALYEHLGFRAYKNALMRLVPPPAAPPA